MWAAPVASGPLEAVVRVPGSKSATNRLLLLAALADGTSRLRAPLRARDTLLMAQALRTLGVAVADAARDAGTRTPTDVDHTDADPTDADYTDADTDADADWLVTGRAGPVDVASVTVDCGNAGTVARFLPAAAAVLARGRVTLDGDPRMRERPLRPLLDALRALGATVDDGGRGAVPLTIAATGRLRGGSVTVDASTSSQLVSGLLLAAPRYDDGVEVRHEGPRVPSRPHLAMTVAALREAGAQVETSDGSAHGAGGPPLWRVAPGPLRALDRTVEPDLSSASAFLAAAAATGGRVRLAGWPAETDQPGRLLPGLLEAFGCTTRVDGSVLEVRGPDRLHGADLDLHDYGEVTPTLTALAVLAATPSRLRGVAHLRLQETDRLAALAEEFGRLGARVSVTDDGLAIEPAPLAAPRSVGPLDPRADHRLAMAYAIVGLVVPGVRVLDISTTGKTVPDFPRRWAGLVS